MFNTRIMAFDSYVPEKVVTNDDLSKIVDTNDEWISSRTGIKQRHISTGVTAGEMCVVVGKRLLEKANISPEEIDLIITATITPDYATPSTACLVQSGLGAVNAFAFDLTAACSGFVYALSVADKYIKSGQCKKALVFGSEVLSNIVDWSDRSTCVLFGDGAGGVLIEASEQGYGKIIAEDMHSNGELGLTLTGGQKQPENAFFTPEEANKKYLQMDGRAIFNFATRSVPASVKQLLEKSNISIDEIKYVVPHQANYRIVEVVAKKLGLPMERFYMNMDKYGNTSSASIPIALAEMSQQGMLEKGDKIVITGFGGGLTWGSILIEI